jgi:hypothetical protein
MCFRNSPGGVLERAFSSNVRGVWKLTPQRPVDNRAGDIEKRGSTKGKCQNATR